MQLLKTQNLNLWVATDKGICVLDRNKEVWYKDDLDWLYGRVNNIIISHNKLFVATEKSFLRISIDKSLNSKELTLIDSLAINNVIALDEDRLLLLYKDSLKIYDCKNDKIIEEYLTDYEPTCALKDSFGRILVGTSDGEVYAPFGHFPNHSPKIINKGKSISQIIQDEIRKILDLLPRGRRYCNH